jgi:hypothetical protein
MILNNSAAMSGAQLLKAYGGYLGLMNGSPAGPGLVGQGFIPDNFAAK